MGEGGAGRAGGGGGEGGGGGSWNRGRRGVGVAVGFSNDGFLCVPRGGRRAPERSSQCE